MLKSVKERPFEIFNIYSVAKFNQNIEGEILKYLQKQQKQQEVS